MTLEQELELNRAFHSRNEKLLLSLLLSQRQVEEISTRFLARHGLTPTQFNALMIVRDYESEGIRQSELARRLLMNRASAGTLVDTLCERNLMRRQAVAGDRRAYHLGLTTRARRLLGRVLGPYYQLMDRVLSRFSAAQKDGICDFLDGLRAQLRKEQG